MKNRLIELLRKSAENARSVDEAADYLISNGVMVLPVKVGQIAYFVLGTSIMTYHIDYIEIQLGMAFLGLRNWEYDNEHCSMLLPETSIGHTLFLTKGEAEEALKRRLKENEHR